MAAGMPRVCYSTVRLKICNSAKTQIMHVCRPLLFGKHGKLRRIVDIADPITSTASSQFRIIRLSAILSLSQISNPIEIESHSYSIAEQVLEKIFFRQSN